MRLFSHVWGHIVFSLKHFTYQQRWDTLAVRAVDVMKFDLQVKKTKSLDKKIWNEREKNTKFYIHYYIRNVLHLVHSHIVSKVASYSVQYIRANTSNRCCTCDGQKLSNWVHRLSFVPMTPAMRKKHVWATRKKKQYTWASKY